MSPADLPTAITDVDRLRRLSEANNDFQRQRLFIRLPGMSLAESRAATDRINGDQFDCGCGFGALGLVLGAGGGFAEEVIRHGVSTVAMLTAFPIAFIAGTTCMVAGKWLGKARARRRVSKTLAALVRSYTGQVD